jgi:hypothetical protein
MWFRRTAPQPDEQPEQPPADRRAPVRWCTTCRSQTGPFVYLENGKHYCRDCAEAVGDVMRLRPDGKRADDVKSA